MEPEFLKAEIAAEADVHLLLKPLDEEYSFNMVVIPDKISLIAKSNGGEMRLRKSMRIRNQYGWVNVFQEKIHKESIFEVIVE